MTVEPNTQTGSKKEAVKDRVENSEDTGEMVGQERPEGRGGGGGVCRRR